MKTSCALWASRQLWKEVFKDDDSFLDLYFNTLIETKNTLAFYDFQTGDAFCRVDFLPFSIKWKKIRLQSFYISGAATAERARGEGRMRQILHVAHLKMWQRGGLLAFLIPQEESLYNYYKESGSYFRIASAKTIKLEQVSFSRPSVALFLKDKEWRQKHLKGPFVEHNFTQWLVAIKNATLYGGGAQWTDDLGLLLLEKISDSPTKWATIVPSNVSVSSLGFLSCSYPWGMARLIHIPRLMHLYAQMHPTLSWKFDLVDKDLPTNSGRYFLHHGKITFHPFKPSNSSLPLFTPDTLGSHIFDDKSFFFDRLMAPIFSPSEPS